MHAFIDEGKYSDMTIDKALRQMLKDFKLPGEHSNMHTIQHLLLSQFQGFPYM